MKFVQNQIHVGNSEPTPPFSFFLQLYTEESSQNVNKAYCLLVHCFDCTFTSVYNQTNIARYQYLRLLKN